jgi:uncharacterized membrane protein
MRSKLLFYFLAVAGILDSVYLLYLEYVRGVCLTGSCSDLPALFGLMWFTAAFFVIKRDKLKLLWQVSGVASIAVLVSIEVFGKFFCPYCTFAHILGLIMVVLSVKFM